MSQVKVLFESEGEIRRYTLPSGAGAFHELTTKIRSVLGPDVHYKLFWKDSEGDEIVCESQLELDAALESASHSGDVLRLNVVITDTGRSSGASTAAAAANEGDADMKEPAGDQTGNSNDSAEFGPKLHPGINCDGCDGEVVGIRYKCKKCADYDLCEKCKDKGFHAEHELETITEPRNFAGEGLPFFPWFGGDRRPGGGCMRGGRGRGGCGRFPGMGFMPRMQQWGPGGMFQAMGGNCASQFEGCSPGTCRNESQQLPDVDQIAQMLKEMGITADGGVIRELIEQFNGDIVKIIEAFH